MNGSSSWGVSPSSLLDEGDTFRRLIRQAVSAALVSIAFGIALVEGDNVVTVNGSTSKAVQALQLALIYILPALASTLVD